MFHSSTATSYCYIIFVQREKLKIWLEDRSSKKQWYELYAWRCPANSINSYTL